MKVRDFIKFLMDFNMDAEVVVSNGNTFDDYEELRLSWGGEPVADGDDKKDADFIWIDNMTNRPEETEDPKYPKQVCKTVKDKIDMYIANNFITDTVVKTDVNSIVKAMFEGVEIGKREKQTKKQTEKPILTGTTTYVDLGLPSGTLWAACNIGAKSEVEFGDHFAWGEILRNEKYCWNTYKFHDMKHMTFKYNKQDEKTELDPCDDAATTYMGYAWKMPNEEQFNELLTLRNKWVYNYKNSGVTGRVFFGTNGNTLFFPAAGRCRYEETRSTGYCGCIWSRSIGIERPEFARYLNIFKEGAGIADGARFNGFSVRGVKSKN